MKFIVKLLALTFVTIPFLFSCKDEEITEPGVQVTTLDFASVGTNTAVGSGYLTKGNAEALTERGICWSTLADPTVADSKAVSTDDAAEHSFSAQLTGLTPNTYYYARAYVSDGSIVHYGNPITFTTKDQPEEGWCLIESVTGLTPSSATVNMTMASDGGNDIAQIGVCFSQSAEPTINDEVLFTVGGRDFSAELSDLKQNTEYYVRPYIKTMNGQITYGEQVAFRTINFIVTKELYPGFRTAYLFGETMKNESDPSIERGFCWSENENPTIETGQFKMISGTEGTFNLLATGFEKGKTYHVRAYAKNSSGTHYGEQMTFTTKTGSILPGLTLEDMILVEKGTFQMGYPQSATVPNLFSGKTLNTETVHSVTLTKDFYICRYQVTCEQICAFLNSHPINRSTSLVYNTYLFGATNTRPFSFKAPMDGGTSTFEPNANCARRPAASITWLCAYEYCRWLSAELGVEVRLPTEAEWEYAARGGNKSQGYLFSGSNTAGEVGVRTSGNAGPQNVGSLKANELGIYDMSGNTFEYCEDVYSDSYYKDGAVDPCNKNTNDLTGQPRCIRGGSFRHYNADQTKDYQVVTRRGRAGNGNTDCGNHSGMRIVMTKLPATLD